MAFSLKQTPVYSGATLLVEFSLDVPLSSMGAYYVVYEGSQQRHVTTARLISPTRLHSIVPSHNIPEDVLVTVVDFQGKDKPSTTLATSSIVFERDGVLHLAQFLIDSVFHLHALENHELIKSDDFNLADEELSSLDWRLRRALTYLTIPDWWSTLGDELNSDHPSPRESLLHFAARLGLTKVAHFFLRKAGSETLLTLPNHQGQLPKDVALDNGFCGLAELLSEYNLKSLLPLGGWIVKEEGRVQTQDTGDVTLTSDIKTHHRSIDEDIKVLQVIQLQVDIGDTDFTSCWQTEWPTAVTAPDMTTADESTTDQMFQEICEKAEELSGIISADDYGDTSEDTYTDPNLDSQHAPAEAWAGEECEVAMETEEATHGHHDGESDDNELMEGSIELIHGVNEQLLARIHEKTAGLQRILDQFKKRKKDLRAENLARFSTSCPHLDVAARNSPLPVIDEADISRSMVDLLDDNTDDCRDGPSSVCSGDTYSSSTPNLADNPVQVTVDGTTLESSSDFGLQAQEYDQCLTDYNNGNVQQVRHRSPLLVRQNGQETAANNMLIHGSKSAQLTPDEDDTDDDSFQNYGSVGYLNSPSDPYRRQLHSVSDVADGKAASLKRDGMSRGSANKNRYSADIETMMRSSKDSPEAMSPMGSGVRSSIHGFMHNKITKAFSMSSIPAATNAEKGKGGTYKGSDKQLPSYVLIQKLIAEHDAQFHNGGKIPEEDYDNPDRHPNSLSHKKQKPEITLLDFLNDSSNFTDSTISLSQKTKEKDEKKRKGGVFSRFNSYRSKTKKNKDKEGKENKNRSSQHRFVSVSFSNATRCDVCHKVLNNKPALRCQSCELNVHESSCKENLTPCDKSRLKGQVPRQSSTENEAMIGGPEPIVSGLVNHSRSASFRDNTTRVPAVYVGSVSQPLYGAEPPLQPEVAKMYTSQDKGQRKSLPSPSLFSSPHIGTYLQWRRASVPNVDRAIVEEEGDSGNVSRLSPIHASADSITRSTESLDEVDGVRTYHYDESELNALDCPRTRELE
ncbi:uncharacterized protein LOC127880245 isoform X2 [Dreissena polymorpha]|uniref:uncharacterized protein LOC127880245 isoform X2 n=1 Tax=Dreissena polymorpha TaxID=45954 RepID=UPI002264A9FF|nr:uncharacterized protein LOC127880245 isoform X2 [Dreissena polymorpha]